MTESDRGFIRLPILIAVVLGLGFAASAYLNYAQDQHSQRDARLLQSQISDLKDQVAQYKTTKSASPSPSPSDSPDPTPSMAPAVAGSGIININQYGVHVTAVDPVTDLTYGPMQSGGLTVVGFTTRSLLARYSACKPGSLGMLARLPKTQKAPSQDKLVKTLGSYSYYFVPTSGSCASDQAGNNTVAADKAALQNGVLSTLSN